MITMSKIEYVCLKKYFRLNIGEMTSSRRTYESIDEDNQNTEKFIIEPKKRKMARIIKSFGPDFLKCVLQIEYQIV